MAEEGWYEGEEYEGEYAEGEYAEGEYAEGEYAGEYAVGEYAEGEYAEGEYAEGEYGEGEYGEGEYGEGEYEGEYGEEYSGDYDASVDYGTSHDDQHVETRVGVVPASFDYDANHEGELSFRAGDMIEVIRHEADGWATGILNGVTGLVSPNFLDFSSLPPATAPRRRGGEVDARKAKRKMKLEERNQLRAQSKAKIAARKELEEQVKTAQEELEAEQSMLEKLTRVSHYSDFLLELVKISMMLDELTASQKHCQSRTKDMDTELKALKAFFTKEIRPGNALEPLRDSLLEPLDNLMTKLAEDEAKMLMWWTNKLEFHLRVERLRAKLPPADA